MEVVESGFHYLHQMRKNLYITVLLAAIISPSFAQPKYDVLQFLSETGHYFTKPLHWDGTDWLTLGALTAGTGLFMTFELPAKDIKFIDRQFYNSWPCVVGNAYGELYTPMVLFLGYGITYFVTSDRKYLKIGYEIGQACLYAGAIVYALKVGVGRARPFLNEGKTTFHPFSGLLDDDNHSFPSGHVAEAAAMSTVLFMNTDNIWLKALALLPAVFTPWARAYQGHHWLSDCAFGAGIGFFTSKWVVEMHDNLENEKPPAKSSLELKSIWPLAICYNF
jgi:membrane-associated phospholipid phosphatase